MAEETLGQEWLCCLVSVPPQHPLWSFHFFCIFLVGNALPFINK